MHGKDIEMKKLLGYLGAFGLGVLVASVWFWRGGFAGMSDEVGVDTVILRDTFRSPAAVRVDTVRSVVRKVLSFQRVFDSLRVDTVVVRDSVEVQLEVVRKEYDGERWKAWVSGVEPLTLDSVSVKSVVVEKAVKAKAKKWAVGFGAGVGVGSDWRLTPYVGIGVYYRIGF